MRSLLDAVLAKLSPGTSWSSAMRPSRLDALQRMTTPPTDDGRRQPLVSVITVFLNAAPFLRQAVESVQAQTYPRWELLLVDDGSTHDGTRLVRELAVANPGRIRHREHAGHRNLGISASRMSDGSGAPHSA